MMSLLHDLARDYQAALIGFGQALLVSGVLVASGYWLKARLLRRWRKAAPVGPRRWQAAQVATRMQARPKPAYFEPPRPVEPSSDRVDLEPEGPAPLEVQSQRIATHVRTTIARGERVRDLHDRALIRLESADYAFQRLVLDLAELISVPQKPEPVPAAMVIGPAPEQATRLAA